MSLEKLKRYVIVQEFTLTVGRFLLDFKRLFIVSSEIVAPVTTSLSLLSIFQGAISALASCHDGYVTRSLYFLSLSLPLFFWKSVVFLETVFVFLDSLNGIVCFKRNREWIINDNRISNRYVKKRPWKGINSDGYNILFMVQTGDLSWYYDNLLATRQTLIARSLIRTSSCWTTYQVVIIQRKCFHFRRISQKNRQVQFLKV